MIEEHDAVVVIFSEPQVRHCKTAHFLKTFGHDALPEGPELAAMMGKFQFLVEGWNDDPQEILRLYDTEAPEYIVEATDNLTTWQSNQEGQAPITVPIGAPVDHGNGTSTITVRHVLPISPATPKRFLRVRASSP